MPQEITLPDGRILVIPDSTTLDQRAALRNKLGSQYADIKTGSGMEQRAVQQSKGELASRVKSTGPGTLTNDVQEEGYRRAYGAENKPGKFVMSDMDVATAGLGGMGIGKSIATRGLKGAAGPIIRGTVGAVGGSAAGGYGGRQLGGMFGHPEEGAQVGSLVGGLAGGVMGGMTGEPIAPPPNPVDVAVKEGIASRIPTRMPKVSPPLGSLENPGPMSKIPTRMPAIQPELGSPANPGPMSKIPTKMPAPQSMPISEGPTSLQHEAVRGAQSQVARQGARQIVPTSESPNMTANLAQRTAEAKAAADAARASQPIPSGVTRLPIPREPFQGEQPGFMASVPREELPSMAARGKPGAGTQLQQLGEPVLYTPPEGYPGPRPSLSERVGTMAPEDDLEMARRGASGRETIDEEVARREQESAQSAESQRQQWEQQQGQGQPPQGNLLAQRTARARASAIRAAREGQR